MHRAVTQQQLERVTSTAIALMIQSGERRLKAATPVEPTEEAINTLSHAILNLVKDGKIAPLTNLERHLYVTASKPNAPVMPPPRTNGILTWDAQLADEIEAKNPDCASLAASVRTGAKERADAFDGGDTSIRLFSLWLYDEGIGCCPYLALYGTAIWVRSVRKAYLKRTEREPVNVPALPLGTLTPTLRSHERGLHPVQEPDGTLSLYSKADERVGSVPTIDAGPLSLLLAESLKRLASYDAQRLLRWEIFTAHEQRHLPDRRRIDITGGWDGLAKKVGISGANAGSRVREIIDTQATMRIQLPGNTARAVSLLSYYERTATGQHPAFVQLVLGPILLPGYAYEFDRTNFETGRDFYGAQRLVPILPIPPLIGRKADWGAQCAFSSWIAVEMRLNAIQIEQRGSVHIPMETLQRLADQASLPLQLLPALMDRWTSAQHGDPPFLQQPEPQRFTLGPALHAAWQHLAAAGKKAFDAKEHGKRAMHKRWHGKGSK